MPNDCTGVCEFFLMRYHKAYSNFFSSEGSVLTNYISKSVPVTTSRILDPQLIVRFDTEKIVYQFRNLH